MCGKSLIIQELVAAIAAKTKQNKTGPFPQNIDLVMEYDGKIGADTVTGWTKLKCFFHTTSPFFTTFYI